MYRQLWTFVTTKCPIRKYGSRTPLLFIPNEEKYQFESEKLTPEQNKAAIPKRPSYSHLPKYHNEIYSPEDIADLIVKLDFRDIFLTCLAKDSPILGDSKYKLVPKDPYNASELINLYFTATTSKWAEVFNEQIYDLSNLPEHDASLNYENRNLMEQISSGLDKFKELTGEKNLVSLENLHRAYKYLKAFENSEKKVAGMSTQSELSPLITFEAVSLYLLNSDDMKQNAENFDIFLSFTKENIQLFTLESLKQFLVLLINNLHESKLSTIQMKLDCFTKFMDTIFETYPSITTDLNPVYLDKLSYLYTMTSNIPKANEILTILVQNYKLSPSKETFNSYLAGYEKKLNASGEMDLQMRKETILRDLSSLKSVFFHEGLNNISFKVLLNNSVSNIHDLEKFLRLVSLSVKGKSLLSKFSSEIIKKLQIIHSTSGETMNVKSLQLSQLVRTIINENDIKLTEEALSLCEKLYSEFNQKSNVEIIQSLNV